MLYIFQVDSGSMMTFDMNLALNSVSSLKEAIWNSCRIPVDRQVLLVSGGECLDPGSRVCNYAAGTDTNPIFLFNKNNIESSPATSGQTAPSASDNLTDVDTIKEQVEGCLALPPTYMTVVSRGQLAQQLWETAQDLTRRCEQLIHDQHLQHQGWAAVVANLEDIMTAFQHRTDAFGHSFVGYLSTKDEQIKILNGFQSDLKLLKVIPIIPTLHPPGDSDAECVSLLDWIVSQDSPNKLESLTESCYRALEKLDASVVENLQKEAAGVLEKAGHSGMKEIKGLEERLFGLDQLLCEARKLVQEQFDLAQAFLQNQNRASDLKDSSILPDLCQSHQHQLLVMSRNHQQLEDIRRRCAKAKEELTVNLNTRLKWVMFVQRSISEYSNKITVYQESLRRLRCQIEIVEQIHSASTVYVGAVVEVVRRKKFSESYVQWSTALAEKMNEIHKREVSHRQEFSSSFEGHFLSSLFTGLDDFPTPFANERPRPFDLNLPKISVEDLEALKNIFPALSYEESIPDFDTEVSSRSDESTKSAIELENENLKLELASAKAAAEMKHNEIEQLVSTHQNEVMTLDKNWTGNFHELKQKLNTQKIELAEKEVKMLELEKYSIEVKGLVVELQKKDKLLRNEYNLDKLRWEERMSELKSTHLNEITALENRLKSQKEDELKELKDKHKSDVDGLRSRYKLMASVEQRSPTDAQDKSFDSLERLPKTEDLLIDLSKTIDMLLKSNPEGISVQIIRGILGKLEGHSAPITLLSSPSEKGDKSPASIRARVNSSEGGASVDSEDEMTVNLKSVYGLDTSAIDATAMCISEATDPAYVELTEMLAPTQQVVSAAISLSQLGRISLQSCKVGEYVFIYWNDKFQAYMVYLNTKNVHFLHTDCLKTLRHSPESPVKGFVAHVTDKEFCVARRAQNRYRVPQGFHFYRVRVKVLEVFEFDSFLSS